MSLQRNISKMEIVNRSTLNIDGPVSDITSMWHTVDSPYFVSVFDKFKQGKIKLFSVGIDEYHNYPKLKTSVKSTRLFNQILFENSFYDHNKSIIIEDHEATRKNIFEKITTFHRNCEKDDLAILHFSGHGVWNEGKERYFLGSDEECDFKESKISSDELLSFVSESFVTTTIVIIDLVLPDIEDSINDSISTFEGNFKIQLKCYLESVQQNASRKQTFCLFLKSQGTMSSGINKELKYGTICLKPFQRLTNNDIAIVKEYIEKIENNIEEGKFAFVLAELERLSKNRSVILYSKILALKAQLQFLDPLPHSDLSTTLSIPLKNDIKNMFEEFIRAGLVVYILPEENHKKETILFLGASPMDLTQLRLEKEVRQIEEELIKSRYRDYFDLQKAFAVRIKDLQDALLRFSPKFVHFAGHGSVEGIYLMDENDVSRLVDASALAGLFKLFSKDIHCVFLNSCHSNCQATAIKGHINKVIGMTHSISDTVAIQFAVDFYKSIGAGRDVDFSFEFAKNSLNLLGLPGEDLPILL